MSRSINTQMDINSEIRFPYNVQMILEWILKFCSIFFFAFLALEMFYLSIKLYSFDLMPCILDGIRNYTALTDQKFLSNVRLYCWSFGYFKDDFFYKTGRFGETFELASHNWPKNENEIRWEGEERNFIYRIVVLHYSAFIVQILFYLVQRRIDFARKSIKNVKDRPMDWYCHSDRFVNMNRIMKIAKNSYLYFTCELFVQIIYHLYLIVLIGSVKLFLCGQYPINNDIDLQDLILFPQFPLLEPRQDGRMKSVVLMDQTFRIIYNEIFQHFWLAFLAIFSLFDLLILVKFFQLIIPALRKRSILSFAPNSDPQILETITSEIGFYYFLTKFARETNQNNFESMLGLMFITKDENSRSNEQRFEPSIVGDQIQVEMTEDIGSMNANVYKKKMNGTANFKRESDEKLNNERSIDSNGNHVKSDGQQTNEKIEQFVRPSIDYIGKPSTYINQSRQELNAQNLDANQLNQSDFYPQSDQQSAMFSKRRRPIQRDNAEQQSSHMNDDARKSNENIPEHGHSIESIIIETRTDTNERNV